MKMTKNNRNKSGRKKWSTLIITLVIILGVSGMVMGGMVWHSKPSFCYSCHTPMYEYADNYFSEDTTRLIVQHAMAEDGAIECLDCHTQTLDEQLTEGVHWVSGNYTFPLETRDFGTRSFCLAEGCHVEEEIIEATTSNHGMSFAFSQHDPRHGKQECNTCHSMHGESVYSCNQCHDFELPEGWVSPQPNGDIVSSLD